MLLEQYIPCPNCAYDLRGNADNSHCPECGKFVYARQSISEYQKWVDTKLLDLWAIAIMLFMGLIASLVTFMAIQAGQNAAVMIGMMGLMHVTLGSVWFLATLLQLGFKIKHPVFRKITSHRKKSLAIRISINCLLFVLNPVLAWFIFHLG